MYSLLCTWYLNTFTFATTSSVSHQAKYHLCSYELHKTAEEDTNNDVEDEDQVEKVKRQKKKKRSKKLKKKKKLFKNH